MVEHQQVLSLTISEINQYESKKNYTEKLECGLSLNVMEMLSKNKHVTNVILERLPHILTKKIQDKPMCYRINQKSIKKNMLRIMSQLKHILLTVIPMWCISPLTGD